MKKSLTLIAASLISCGLSAQTTLISNIQGYTLANNKLKEFKAIQFTNDKIDKIFGQGEPLPSNPNIEQINGLGKTLLPGLIDAHGHILSYGLSLLSVDLVGSSSEKNAIERVVKYAKNNPDQAWITGRGWNQVLWSSNTFPTAELLDKVFPDIPIWLERVDGHAGWANSKAMELAGITENSISPEGGEIIKDKSGKPSGVFIDNAMQLITVAIPKLNDKQHKIALKKAMHSLVSMGLTSVHDAGIDSNNIKLFKELANSNEMPIRVNAMLYLPSDGWQNTLKQGHYKTTDDIFAFNSVKIQADGALGSRGAALIEDYSDHAGHKGLLLHDTASLNSYIETAMNAGFQVNTHAIGDNANKITLDLYQKNIEKTQSKSLRHRVEHAQILRLDDIPRFAQLGVIASMQATHATSDKNMAQDRIGPERILGAYAWRKLLNAQAIIAAGSDFPVESPNPFFGLHASITRQDHQNAPEGGWFPYEKMTRAEALKTFTIDAAYSGHQETIIGELTAGKKADFILIDQNYFTMPEQDIWQTKVLSTWVNGKEVYKAQ